MQSEQIKPTYIWWLLAGLAFLLFFRLGAAPIYILDEAKNAQCAREMLLRGDWIVPTFNGELRTDKPVLHYYFMMLAYKMFGINAFAARFFSAMAGWLAVYITYLFTRRYTNHTTAFFTALALAASTHFLFEFRLSVPDPYLIFFVMTGLYAAYLYIDTNRWAPLLVAALSFALATLAKGPVALALPGLCLLVWMVLKKKWTALFNWKLVPAVLLLAVVTLPWYIAVHKATNGAWTRGFFIEHNLNRFSDPQEGHGGFFLLTLVFVLVGLLPFSGMLGEIIKRRRQVFMPAIVQFSGIVVLAFVVFFSFASTRLPNYPMPCYPFAGIIIGHYLAQLANNTYAVKKYTVYIVLALLLLLPVAAFVALGLEAETKPLQWVSMLLFGGAAGVLYLVFNWRYANNSRRLIMLAGAYSVFNMLVLHLVYPLVYMQNPVKKTLATVLQYRHVVAYEIYNPGYNFYLPGNIPRYHSAASLGRAIDSLQQVVVLSRSDYADTLQKLNLVQVAAHRDLFELPTTVLYAPKPAH